MKYLIQCRVSVTVALVACIVQQANAAVSRAFVKACQNGADAQVAFHVTDDLGCSVPRAKVDVFFDMLDRSKARQITGDTDTNGFFVAEARTGGVLKIRVSCDGYYSSKDEISFIDMGHEHEVKRGRWQPWGMEKEIVLRPVKNPVAKMPQVSCAKYTRNMGDWIGFDIEKYDFVAPDGNGVYADMEIKFDWDGRRGDNFHGMDVGIRFSEPHSGAYYQDRIMTSDFKDAYFAVTNETYQKEFGFYSHPVRDDRGKIIKREQKFFDSTKSLIVRSRCMVNEDGTLKQARYSEISDLTFGCGDKGAWVMFQPIFNPTPNDTNLEPKR